MIIMKTNNMIRNGIIMVGGLITVTNLGQRFTKAMEIMLDINILHTQWVVSIVDYIILADVQTTISMIENITTKIAEMI